MRKIILITMFVILLSTLVSANKWNDFITNDPGDVVVQDSNGNALSYDVDVKITGETEFIFHEDNPVKRMKFKDLERENNKKGNKKTVLGAEKLPIDRVKELKFVKLYAIDPTNLNFTEAEVEVEAKGKALYKCATWNFASQKCNGNKWKLLRDDLVPGETYKITITPDDPGFGEIETIPPTYHMDENYTIIQDIYNETKAIDDIWSPPIYHTEQVRAVFAQDLVNGNVIDMYIRDGSGNQNISLELWVNDSYEEDIYVWENVTYENGTNGTEYVYNYTYIEWEYELVDTIWYIVPEQTYFFRVKNLDNPTNTFDIKIIDHNNVSTNYIEFDHIHDADPLSVHNGSFFEGFETANFAANNWTTGGTGALWAVSTLPPSISGIDPYNGTYSAFVEGTGTESTLYTDISTVGYKNINFSFWWTTAGLETPEEYFAVDYWNSTDWVELQNGEAAVDDVWNLSYYLLPSVVDNYENFSVRFRCLSGLNSEECAVDDIRLQATPTLNISLLDYYAIDSNDTRIDDFNSDNLDIIDEVVLKYNIFSSDSTVDEWYFNFTADGATPCSLGNKQSSICYNYDNETYKWIQFIEGQETATFRDEGVIGDYINATIEGNSSNFNLTLIIEEHYNPNVIKFYQAEFNFSDEKNQTGSNEQIKGDGNYIKISIPEGNIPQDADIYKLDFRVTHNNPTEPLNVYACNNSYVDGEDPIGDPRCWFIGSNTAEEITSNGNKFSAVITNNQIQQQGGANAAILYTDETNLSKYYALRTYKATTPNWTTTWQYTNDNGLNWTNNGDGYETDINVNWFYDGADPTKFVFSLWANESSGDTTFSENSITWDIDPVFNYPPVAILINPLINEIIQNPYNITYGITEPNYDNLNVSLELYQNGVYNKTLDNYTLEYTANSLSNVAEVYLSFDNGTVSGTTITDISGNGWDGTKLSSTEPLQNGSGVINDAVSFDGSNDYIDITNFSNPNSEWCEAHDNSEKTFNVWVNALLDTNFRTIIDCGFDPDASSGWGLYYNVGTSDLTMYHAGSGSTFSVPEISDSNYHMITVIFDNGNMSLYRNTTYLASATITNTTYDTGTHIGIWSDDGVYASAFRGEMDEFSVYDKALTQSEIDYLYAENNPIAGDVELSTHYYWVDTLTLDGIYDLNLTACETETSDLYCDSDVHEFTLDNNDTVVTILSPINGTTYIISDIDLNWTFDKPILDAYFIYNGDSANYSIYDGGPLNITLDNIEDGPHNVTVYVIEADDNTTDSSETIYFEVETTVPEINITFPINGSSYNYNVPINYTLIEENPDTCKWTIDGGVTNNTVPCGDNITNATWNQGINNFTLYANDTVGNSAMDNVTFFIDSVPPVVDILYPTNNTLHNTTMFDISYTANDLNLHECWWSKDNGTINTSIICGDNITGQTWEQGNNTITVYANDTFGSRGQDSVIFLIDSIAPNITINVPPPDGLGQYTNVSTIGLDVDYSDGYLIESVNVTCVDLISSSVEYTNTVSGINQSTYNLSDNVIFNDIGVKVCNASTIDVAGNPSSQEWNFTIVAGKKISFYGYNEWNGTQVSDITIETIGPVNSTNISDTNGNVTFIYTCDTEYFNISSPNYMNGYQLYANNCSTNDAYNYSFYQAILTIEVRDLVLENLLPASIQVNDSSYSNTTYQADGTEVYYINNGTIDAYAFNSTDYTQVVNSTFLETGDTETMVIYLTSTDNVTFYIYDANSLDLLVSESCSYVAGAEVTGTQTSPDEYSCVGTFNDSGGTDFCEFAFDGDQTSYTKSATGISTIYLNYTAPTNTNTDTTFNIKSDITGIRNLTLDSSCIKDTMELRVTIDNNNNNHSVHCNGTDWVQLESENGGSIYYTAMGWNYNSTQASETCTDGIASNISITLLNDEVGYSQTITTNNGIGVFSGNVIPLGLLKIQVQATGYDTLNLFDNITLANYPEIFELYMVETTDQFTKDVVLHVQDSAGTEIEDANIRIYAQNVSDTEYYKIMDTYSDSNGEALVTLVRDNIYYLFTIYDNQVKCYETSSSFVIKANMDHLYFTCSISDDYIEVREQYNSIEGNINCNNDTNTTGYFNLEASADTESTICLEVRKSVRGTYEVIEYYCENTTSFYYSATVDAAAELNDAMYTGVMFAKPINQTDFVKYEDTCGFYIDLATPKPQFGTTGIFLMLLLLISIVFALIQKGDVACLAFGGGFFMGTIPQLNFIVISTNSYINMAAGIAMLSIMGIIAWVLNQRAN